MARYCNDLTAAAAYPPAMLLKVILFDYNQGLDSCRVRKDVRRGILGKSV
ncbi:hypothetical protein PROAA_2100006 [Candidatus Propionivibrio aalborgensis]|uniref:Uncharacterized protein n=1 Tax=Candidatus Propionivibrio aalborgensis TaxID=1860101 RepID=A0A1A8XRT9_9RHOO|nr:hypothetical protein [Candidatus Propionivibrio aalborgensis]SBT07202.1 hypothetical protein PROAA_2100006 [Candidatus Propionivibrio aalborgensis]